MEASGVQLAAEKRTAAKELPFQNAVQMFVDRVKQSGPRQVFRFKQDGAWRTATWNDWDQASREIAGGLIALGVGLGERACILANTRAEWMHCDVGILMAGAVTVPIYQSNVPHECEYIINDCGAQVVFAENPHQIEKLMQERDKLGGVKRIVWFDDRVKLEKPDPAGRIEVKLDDVVPADRKDWVMSLAELRAAGRKWLGENAGELERRWEKVTPADTFTIVYTSGTTGPPKGVVLTHENIVFTTDAVKPVLVFDADDEQLLFLPLAHIFAKILEWCTINRGSKIAFAESVNALVSNLADVKPSFMGAVPRVYEKVYAKIQANRAAAPPTKQKIFDWAFAVGREVSKLQQQGRPIPLGLSMKRAVAEKLVFGKIKAVLGGRIKFLVSGGAPLAREIAEFFHAAGLLILEGYGLTETTAASFVNRPDRYKFGTVGPIIPGLEVKIAEDGEILVRGRSVLKEYYNKPDATREVLDPPESGGWFHTGDIGVLEDGMLRITDRKKDLIVTAGGKNVAPQNLENGLKTQTPLISQVMVHGDKRAYLTALVTVNDEAAKGLSKEDVRAAVQKAIDAVNAREPSYSTIKKFALLDKDFAQETGELTPTLKVKRKYCTEKYKAILDGFYAN